MNEKEATEKLAAAMDKLADRLMKFQDPVLWQKVLSDAVRTAPGLLPGLSPSPLPGGVVGSSSPYQPTSTLLLPVSIEGVTVSLSDEERDKLVAQVYHAVQPEIAAFSEFVKLSLKDMPPHRLKSIASKVQAGEKVELHRRSGCVFLKAGDEEVYLNL